MQWLQYIDRRKKSSISSITKLPIGCVIFVRLKFRKKCNLLGKLFAKIYAFWKEILQQLRRRCTFFPGFFGAVKVEKNSLLFTQPIANYVKKIMINQRVWIYAWTFLQTKILSLTWKNKLLLEIIIILFFKSKFLSNQNN